MKPFNLQEFQKDPSRKIVTRRGFSVRIICTDAKNDRPIVALVSDKDGTEFSYDYYENGKYYHDSETSDDLFFAPENKECWANLYCAQSGIVFSGEFFKTEEVALKEKDKNLGKYITTFKVEWEE